MKVKIQHPGLPNGYQLTLTGLNVILLNNEEVEVSDEAIAQYEVVSGKKFSDVIKGAAFTGKKPTPVEVTNTPPPDETGADEK